jgi:hypothetical protein
MRETRWFVVAWFLMACGGGETPPPATPAPAPPAPAASPAPPAPAAEKEAQAPATEAKPSPEKPAEPAAAEAAPAENTARNVKYVVNPEGMRVELEGVSFAPKAEVVKSGAGYALKFKVEVRAKDGKPHSLLAPKNTEVAFAGAVKRKDQAPEEFGDRRDGDREVALKGEKPVTLSRSWPSGDMKPLAPGDELDLMVGIWGLGDDAASRRPLKKFCKVTVTFEKGQPRAKVAPPDGTSR